MPRRTILIIGFAQLINYGVPLVTFPLLVRAFALPVYGMWIEVNTIVSLAVALGTLGLAHALGLLVVSRAFDPGAIYATSLWLFGGISSALAVVIFLLAPWIDAATTRDPLGAALLQINAWMLPCVAMNQLASQMYRLRGQALRAAVIDTLLALARVAAAGVALLSQDVITFAQVFVGMQLVLTLAQVSIAFWGQPLLRPHIGIIRALLRQSVNLAVAGQANWLVMYGDRLMLSILSVSSAVAVYAASYQLTLIVSAFAWPFLYPLLGMIGERWQQGDLAGVQAITRQTTRAMLILLIPAVVGLSVIGDNLMRFLATDDFAQGGLLIGMIALGVSLDLLGTCLQYIHQAQGKGDVIRRVYLRGALLNILANLIAIPLFSYLGAGLTTLLTFLYIFIGLWWATGMRFEALVNERIALLCLLCSGPMALWAGSVATPAIERLLLAMAGGALIYGAGLIVTGVFSLAELRQIAARMRQRFAPAR